MIRALLPHLAVVMPGVTSLVPWLLLLDAIMLLGAPLAVFALNRHAMRLVLQEAPTAQKEWLASSLDDTQRRLRRGRYLLLLIAVLFLGVFMWAKATDSAGPEWNELTAIVYAGVILPTYVTTGMLANAFRGVAKRLKNA